MTMVLGLMLSLPFNREVRQFLGMRFATYLASLGFYHWAEYLYVCIFHFNILNLDSKSRRVFISIGFLINQSWAYGVAIAVSLAEYLVT